MIEHATPLGSAQWAVLKVLIHDGGTLTTDDLRDEAGDFLGTDVRPTRNVIEKACVGLARRGILSHTSATGTVNGKDVDVDLWAPRVWGDMSPPYQGLSREIAAGRQAGG